jgi:hypothetical protein
MRSLPDTVKRELRRAVHSPYETPIVVAVNGALITGLLPLAGWLGIYFPYHPMPLKRRWELRHRWWSIILRWLSLANRADSGEPVRVGCGARVPDRRAVLVARLDLGRAHRAPTAGPADRASENPDAG